MRIRTLALLLGFLGTGCMPDRVIVHSEWTASCCGGDCWRAVPTQEGLVLQPAAQGCKGKDCVKTTITGIEIDRAHRERAAGVALAGLVVGVGIGGPIGAGIGMLLGLLIGNAAP